MRSILIVSLFTAVSSFLLMIILAIYLTIAQIQFTANCSGFLKKAADSSSYITASEQIGYALDYCNANNLTNGRSHAIYYTQDCDIKFWYDNLVEQKQSLDSINESTTDLEISNRMIRMREVLTDVNDDGTSITCPANISLYPYQFITVLFNMSSVFLGISCLVIGLTVPIIL